MGGLDGGLWWFSDGDETKGRAGLTMMDRRWEASKTQKKPVARLEGVGPLGLHPDH